MTTLRLAQFSGEIPRLIARLLPDTGAQHAENVRLDDGGLTPVRKSKLVQNFDGMSDVQTIYKWGSDWLAWDTVVHAVPGPVATDRLYYTGDGAPKMRVGVDVYDLALAYPTTKLTVTLSGSGSGDVVTRLYVYTFVTEFGEESEPCPISDPVSWQSGKTVTLSGFQIGDAARGVTKQRIYRSQSSNQAGTDLFFIAERDTSTSNFTDTYAPEAFGEVLPSKDWNAPPDDMQGLIAMPNGMMAAFAGKKIYFCEPYRPHAWPEKYVLTTPYEVVALSAYGTTLVAGTKGYPYVVSGTAPENMVEEKVEVNLPCINGRGMVDLGYSAAYPSNDGLVVVSSAGPALATSALFTRADWQRINPDTIVSGQFAGRYFASYSYTELDSSITAGTIIIDLKGEQPFVVQAGFKADAFYYDMPTGALYYLVGTTVYEYDALWQTNEIMAWKSKRFVFPAPVSFGAVLVESGKIETIEEVEARKAEIAAIEAYNATIFAGHMGSEIDGAEVDAFSLNGDPLKQVPSDKFASVMIYADGKLVRTVSKIDMVCRIPPAKAKVWEVQVNGTQEVEQITLATTMRELNEV